MSLLTGAAPLLGGLGLFLISIRALSTHMLQLAGTPLRRHIAAMPHNPAAVITFGTLIGVLMQSSSAVTFTLDGLARAGVVAVPMAMALLLWANVGSSALVIAASLDLRTVVLLLIGCAGLGLYFSRHRGRPQQLLELVLALGLLFLGLQMMRGAVDSARDTAGAAWMLAKAAESPLAAFALGALVTVVAQSSSVTTITAIAGIDTGLLSFDAAAAVVLGAGIGSGAAVTLTGWRARGQLPQLVAFQCLTKLTGSVCIGAVLIAQSLSGVPLLSRAAEWLSASPGRQVAAVYVACQLAAVLAHAALGGKARALIAWLAPSPPETELARPRFISENVLADSGTALLLAGREQERVACLLAAHLPGDAASQSKVGFEAIGWAARTLLDEIDRFLGELSAANASSEPIEDVVRLYSVNETLRALHETLGELAPHLQAAPAGGVAEVIREGLGTLLLCAEDAARSANVVDAHLLLQMTQDRSGLVESIRRRALATQAQSTTAAYRSVYAMTALYERAVWLLQRYGTLLKGAG